MELTILSAEYVNEKHSAIVIHTVERGAVLVTDENPEGFEYIKENCVVSDFIKPEETPIEK